MSKHEKLSIQEKLLVSNNETFSIDDIKQSIKNKNLTKFSEIASYATNKGDKDILNYIISNKSLIEKALVDKKDTKFITAILLPIRHAENILGKTDVSQLIEDFDKKKTYFEKLVFTLLLYHIKDERVLDLLFTLLKDNSSDVRAAAATAFSYYNSDKAKEPLLALLQDDVIEVREGAALALTHIADNSSIPVLIEQLEVDNEDYIFHIAFALITIGKESIEYLIEATLSENLTICKNAMDILLWSEWKEAIPVLCDCYNHTDPDIRTKAIHCLTEFPATTGDQVVDDLIVPTILSAFNDKNKSVQISAAHSIKDNLTLSTELIDRSEVIDSILNKKLSNRSGLFLFYASIGLNYVIKPLQQVLYDAEETIGTKISAITSISLIDDVKAIEILRSALVDFQDEKLATAIVGALGYRDDVDTLIEALEGKIKGVIRYAVALNLGHVFPGSKVDNALLKALGDRDEDVRAAAAEMLGYRNVVTALPNLIKLSGDPSIIVRKTVCLALSYFKMEDSIIALIDLLNDAINEVREAARTGLMNIGAPALEPLLQNLGNDQIKDEIIQVLEGLGTDVLPTILSFFNTKHSRIVDEIISKLPFEMVGELLIYHQYFGRAIDIYKKNNRKDLIDYVQIRQKEYRKSLGPKERKKKKSKIVYNIVLVDGSNIAREGDIAKIKRFNIVNNKLITMDKYNQILFICDANLRFMLKHESEVLEYNRMISEGKIKEVPGKTDADYFILQYADMMIQEGHNVEIVTNDQFRDYISKGNFPWLMSGGHLVKFDYITTPDGREMFIPFLPN